MRDDPSLPLTPRDPLQGGSPTARSPADGDAALAVRLANGDATALDAMYRRHRAPVYRFALLWTGSPALAADVTQDVFLHLLTRAADYDPARGSLLPWLLGIARNFARRRTGTTGTDPLSDDEAIIAAPDPAPCTVDALVARHDLERQGLSVQRERGLLAERGKGVTEKLGTREVEGVRAEGTRTTWTIASGAIGNDKPIVSTSEQWYSPDLHTTVLARTSDPRSGETTYRLANIRRVEPSPDLFRVPPDYRER